jgi:hypothetical protein
MPLSSCCSPNNTPNLVCCPIDSTPTECYDTLNRYLAFRPPTSQTIHSPTRIVTIELGGIQKLVKRWNGLSCQWGPRVWYYIHKTASFYYGQVFNAFQIALMIDWVHRIPFILPCPTCRFSYTKYIKDFDIPLICSNGVSFYNFFVDMHTAVNVHLGKPVTPNVVVDAYFLPFWI